MEPVADTDVAAMFEAVKNWGRWGADDERGALNLITPELVAAASRLVVTGEVVSCSLPLPTTPSAEEPSPAQHMMLASGDALDATGIPGFQQTVDFLGIACHGMGITHIDALCHVLVGDEMYNGINGSAVRSTGATRNSIAAAATGVVTHGVFLDIPRLRQVDWLGPEDPITAADLDEAVRRQGVSVPAGSAVLISTGRDARRTAEGPRSPFAGMGGLHPSCIPWLREHDVAVLGSDGISDTLPPRFDTQWAFPIHQCAIAAIGLHLIDNMSYGPLSRACAAANRWEFLFMVGPLRAELATGCAVNPIAVL